ncbi:MAG: hypothetical protein QOC96_2272 [Acidobacteriota bacterium]|jgi:hypothetical protein|nr:hypothetical protein [Acidobacteriota bacterium]
MRNKYIVSVLAFLLALVLSDYVYLSVYVGRALKVSEFTRFSGVVLRSALFHRDEGGASKALVLSKEALSSAPSQATIETAGQSYAIPLPKYALHQEVVEGRLRFLAFIADDEIQDYFNHVLPEAGWKQVDQMGAGHFLEGYGVHMVITQHFYLTTGISEFYVSIRE